MTTDQEARREEQIRATQIVASAALANPLWDFDSHVANLLEQGISKRTVNAMSRPIAEAMNYSQHLIIERAQNDGWRESPDSQNMFESPDGTDILSADELIQAYT